MVSESIAKARLYRTARIVNEAWEVPDGFVAGEYVSVVFLRKSWGSCVYQCMNAAGAVAAISDLQLDSFVL